jgi:hypothetical protein
MFSAKETNEFIDIYIKDISKINFQKKQTLENFRKIESDFKFYQEALNELEKQQAKINLNEFENLKNKTIKILSDIDCKNMEFNINKVNEIIKFFNEIETDFIEVSTSLISIKKKWSSFENRNEDIKNTIFSKHIEKKLEEIEYSINNIVPNEIGILSSTIEELKSYIDKLIIKIGKVKEYYNLNIFIGEENELIKEELKSLINFKDLDSIDTFYKKTNQLFNIIDQVKKNSITGLVRVPVYKVFNEDSPNIFKYTVKFGDFYLKYDYFFNNSKLTYKKTNEYIFLNNFPLKGIFSGKEIVNNLIIDNTYIKATSFFEKKIFSKFIQLSTILLIIGLISPFINGIFSIFYLFTTITSLFLFKRYISFFKKKVEKKYKRKQMFIFNKVDFFYTHIGEDTSLESILLGIIQNFNDTITNKKFHKSIKGDI